MSIRAILFGATGMVGEGVLHEALKDDAVESILVGIRSGLGVAQHTGHDLLRSGLGQQECHNSQLQAMWSD
jgi:hypothetical protein